MKWFKNLQQSTAKADEPDRKEVRPAGKVLKYPRGRPAIWSVGGGKGGVGKSMVAANLAVTLSKLGEKVLVVDADFGAANLHTFFGINGARPPLCRFLNGTVTEIEGVISKTPVPNLEIISGAKDPLDAADIKTKGARRLKDGLRGVDHDYVILDIGPGTSSSILDLFLLADQGILVTTPEPTSIENTYRLMKCLFLRKMRNTINGRGNDTLKGLLHKVFSPRWSERIRTFADIFTELRRLDPVQCARLKSMMKETGISVLVNQARGLEDEGLGPLIRRGCLDYFDLEVKNLGFIRYDESVKDSVRDRRPLTIHYSGSRAAGAFEACIHKLLDGKRHKGTA